MDFSGLCPGRPGATRFAASVVALGIFSIATAVSAALGQSALPDAPGPWQASVFGGWYSGARPYVFRGAFSDEVQFESAPAFGLRVGYDLNRRLGLELAWTGAEPEQAFVSAGRGSIRHVSLNAFELNLKVYVGSAAVRGFATFGMGGANTGSSYGGANFTANLGIGALAFLDRHFAVRLDARINETYGNVGENGDPAFCDRAGCYFYKRNWYPSAGVTAGLVYAF